MKKHILEFIRRGMMACSLGPLVLAVLYLILQHQGLVQTIKVSEICLGIVSLSALAFIAGGMNMIYQVEHLPLMAAISIHGGVLYIAYLVTYLVNGWLGRGITPLLVFSAIFILGFLLIWAGIYFITKRNTERLNEILKQDRQFSKEK